MNGEGTLFQTFIYLLAAVISVPVAKRLGLGSVLGYLLAGVAIGSPAAFRLTGHTVHLDHILHFSEYGVVMMLFLVGLELRPARLWELRGPVLGMGALQVLGTATAVLLVAIAAGMGWRIGAAAGLILAMSSTAIVLQSLGEKGLLKTPGGEACFSVLLFQDLSVIPILAVLPLLATGRAGDPSTGNTGTAAASGIGTLPGWLQGVVTLGTVAAIVFGLSVAALVAARPTISSLLEVPHYSWFLFGSLGWAILVSLVTLGTLAGQASQRRQTALATILVLNASVLFSIPLLAGARNRELDLGGVAFLRSHLGLQRVYTMGPMGPNYGTFFGIATIDYNSVLVPSLWVDYIHRHLDPGTVPMIFDGVFPKPSSGSDIRDEVFRQNEAAFATIGVRYVVRPAGRLMRLMPFGIWKTITAHALTAGQSMQVQIPGALVQSGNADVVELVLGLYAQRADGKLALRVCQQDRCRQGSAQLKHAVDNGTVKMDLAGSLTLLPGVDVILELRREGGISPVAVWYNDRGPLVSLDYLSLGKDPPPVYYGSVMRIDEVPGASAYANAPSCLLTLGDRDHLVAQCASPSTLTRLELDYPGWQANLNGRPVAIARRNEIFQSVPLPVGRSAVIFTFSPSGEGPTWWVCGSGLIMTICMALQQYRKKN